LPGGGSPVSLEFADVIFLDFLLIVT